METSIDQQLSSYINPGYLCEKISSIFSEKMRIARWLEVEGALAESQGELGVIPEKAAATIRSNAYVEKISMETVLRVRKETNHSLIPVTKALGEKCGEQTARFIHYGATTQDIQDTGQSIALKQVIDVLEKKLQGFKQVLLSLMKEHSGTICMGRTHYRPALPITFGLKVGSWLDELSRNLERLEESKKRVLAVQIFGAVGSAAAFGANIQKLEALVACKLGLEVAHYPWHTSRDRIMEFLHLCTVVCSMLARIANEIIHLSRPEVGEIHFKWPQGTRCSSTMPHKRNPEECEHVVTLSRLCYGQSMAYLSAPESAHERDFRNVRMEWMILPACSTYTSKALSTLSFAFEQMEIRADVMKENVVKFSASLSSENLMFSLGEKMGKHKAYELLSEIFELSSKENSDPREAIYQNSAIKNCLNKEELDAIFQANYIGQSKELVQGIIDREG